MYFHMYVYICVYVCMYMCDVCGVQGAVNAVWVGPEKRSHCLSSGMQWPGHEERR